ncbi:hypothetical protein KC19_2G146700 [Ceratodon purpureus]|uniref:ZZ-type domain-containing protein n=1 Tax=Ceratodon purpureus TaxID=3225 RepID=A0A8T0IWU8_CERPU|nr:hypothetical protein KC19_2G146700 [Ceratodon purpureus]
MGEVKKKFTHGEPVSDAIFRFYQPKVPVQLEVVFVHGLVDDNSGDAYWKTWLARDGTPNNVWPMTWLPAEFPFAQVYALKYDASMNQTATDGRMDLFLVGENLVQEMVDFGQIGQNGVPVVFVCHGFGGLVAKQIVVSAKSRFSQDRKAQNLLQNIRGFNFYSTPHRGSVLAEYLHNAKRGGKGPLLANMQVLDKETSRLSEAFEKAKYPSWYFASAAETHATSQVSNNVFALVSSCLRMFLFHFRPHKQMVVEEASSRYEDGNYLALSENHSDIVRPKAKNDSSYLLLTKSLREVVRRFEVSLAVREESLVPESFVRLKEQEEAIRRLLQEVSIVGVVGMGGIGKTTLAKAVYQSICKDFDRSSYLDDVKSKASLDEVLVTLLQDFKITDRTGSIVQLSALKDSKDVLLEDLKKYVQQHEVLVVVDDVGTKENLDRLLKDMGFLTGNKESRLIVTCRNWQVLKEYVPLVQRYDMEFMSSGMDIELFSYHAFQGARTVEEKRRTLHDFLSKDSSEHLMEKFEIVCGDVVKACCGLPLSLEVMGRFLGGYLKDDLSSEQCLDCWKGALEKLKNAEPLEGGDDNDKLWKVLQISYDALRENEQNMFLDIACFFSDTVQYSEQTLLRIWGGKQSKLIELRNLKERCLVKINREDGVVTMHDQLRDMGRGVVRGQGRLKVKKMSRLWDCEDVGKLLQSNEIKSEGIEGLSLYGLSIQEGRIMLNHGMKGEPIETKKKHVKYSFNLNCPKMRLLNLQIGYEDVIEAINIEGPSHVQWLCLRKSSISKVPIFLQQCKELCVLDMRQCFWLEKLPNTIGKLDNLLELNLYQCERLTSLPESIGELVKLSKLDLSGCLGLTCLPESIGKLSNLLKLHLNTCERLASLPKSIGELVKLSKLDLSWCYCLTCLPESIGKLSNLLELNLQVCKKLSRLPESIGELVKLSKLDLSRCLGFTCLPESIGKLSNLLQLNLDYCERLTSLPESIGKLVKLSKLDLSSGYCLTCLPEFIGKLSNLLELNLQGCKKLSRLPETIGELVKLSKLDLSGCLGLTCLPESIGKLSSLLQLNLRQCKELSRLPETTEELVKLSKLDLSWCYCLTCLPESIGKLSNLLELNLRQCKELLRLPESIGELVKLSKLNLSWCVGFTCLPESIGKLSNLLELNLQGCKKLSRLPETIGELVKLSKLDLSCCLGLTCLPESIGKLSNLLQLNLRQCKELSRLPETTEELVKLSKLDLSWCYCLTCLPESIGKLSNLLELNLRQCKELLRLPESIGELVKLSKLNLSWCVGFTCLPESIGKLSNLLELNLQECKKLSRLPESIGELVKLSKLDLSCCLGLTCLPEAIGKLSNLLELNLQGCKKLSRLPETIGELVKLSKLDLSWCYCLTCLPESIGKLSNLLELNLQVCKKLSRLPESIGELVKFSKLNLSWCVGLTCLPESIGKLSNLLELNLQGCKKLSRLPESIGELVKLSKFDLTSCKGLTCLPESIGKLSNLLELNLWRCIGLIRLPDTFGNLTQLQVLVVNSCENLVELPQSAGRLSQLPSLNLSNCHKWDWMKASQISVLHELKQHGCSEILLPDGRSYDSKYSTEYCSSGKAGCDGCGLNPISTKCWHCDICPEFDLCESCYERRRELDQLRRQSEHVEDHPMTAITVL